MGMAIKEYLAAIFRYWWTIVISYFFGAVGFALAIQAEISIAGWVWGAVAIGGFAVAQFLAFRDVRFQRDELENKRIQQSHVDALSDLRSEAIHLILNGRVLSADELTQWQQTLADWMGRTTGYLERNFTRTDRLKFERIGTIKEMPSFGHAFNSEHARALGHFAIRLERLESIIDVQSRAIRV